MSRCTQISSSRNAPVTGPSPGYRELSHRESGGVSVRLWWCSIDDEIFVHVRDEREGSGFVLNPPKRDALIAFRHPYAAAGLPLAAVRTAA